jgi:serine/threonine protein kinase
VVLTPSSVRSLSRQLLSALAYIHGQGLLVRDLKPEKIIINSDATKLKLINFVQAADIKTCG